MQSAKIKVFKDGNGHIFVLFYKDGSIFIKEYRRAEDEALKVSENVLPVFSVCYDNGRPVVIVKKTNGDIYICRYKGEKWEERLFLNASPYDNTKFYIYTLKDRTDILYNCPSEKKGEETLNAVSFVNKKWQLPVVCENIKPLSSSPYMVINITPYHLLVFCNKQGEGLAMKEISLAPLRIGKAVSLFPPTTVVSDVSSVIAGDTIHMAFVINVRRGSQLIYKNKNSAGFSENRIIWENGRINSCVLFVVKERVWLVSTVGNGIFCSYSDDNGKNFCPVYRHRMKLSSAIIKAEFVSGTVTGCSEVYVCSATNEIVLMNDFCEEFSVKEAYEDKKTINDNAGISEEVRILKNKNEIYEKQLNEANKKIGELSRKLAQRNEELSVINSRWMRRMNSLNKADDKKYLPAVIDEILPQGVSSP
ncbi:MAG: hypothetical protein E7235_05440 [Lachnospiraceae bacterium]|nr:hypothetical protein [Lachnospiraceae bacterium]